MCLVRCGMCGNRRHYFCTRSEHSDHRSFFAGLKNKCTCDYNPASLQTVLEYCKSENEKEDREREKQRQKEAQKDKEKKKGSSSDKR